ncbi:uncharacterized protein TRIADDRAFT_28106, partial [Trichoplax adhaerens]
WEISRTSIKLIEKLGQGAFGEVYRGLWNNTTPVAVKTMKQGTMSGIEFLKEAAIMKKLRHPKLIQLYAICKSEPIYIITELMENGSLLDYLRDKDRGHKLQLPQLINITAQVAYGMAYLETQKYIHRDLAARNVLVGENLECKVADFGLARDDLYASKPEASTKLPIKWTAPEALIYSKFSIKSDVWSFGILMYEVITYGGQPYIGMKGQEVISKIQCGYRLECPSNCPEHYYNLMLECWQKDPEQRLTFQALQSSLEHFFEDKDSYLEDQ